MSDATLRGRLTAALDADPHYSTSDVVATVMRVLGETGGDLRNRIADAIRRVVRISPGPNTLADLNAGRSIPISGGEADDAALAVMPVVQAALTEQTQRAVEAAKDARDMTWNHLCADMLTTWTRATEIRAEKAERERDEARAAVQRLRDLLEPSPDGSAIAIHRGGAGEERTEAVVPRADIIAALDRPEDS